MVTTNAEDENLQSHRYASAEHLVDVVARVFGSSVERIIVSSWVQSWRSLEEIYWPHTEEILKLKDM